MKLYNSLLRKLDNLRPLNPPQVSIYSCGPTVYDHIHIGNFRTYIFEDTLRRVLGIQGCQVKHVMNITDIDDKTIKRSQELYPNEEPKEALKKLTRHFEELFFSDAHKLGIDFSGSKIARATEHIGEMQESINKIDEHGFAYATDDGIFFDTSKYHDFDDHIHPYGILTPTALQGLVTETQRTEQDEYEKHEAIDFSLWKVAKAKEPNWPYSFHGKDMKGRPGWHIECSVMAAKYLGQPFDIHTGGVDLIFPHHENEIAQAQAARGKQLAKMFIHGEHLLVDGQRMGKRFKNFFTVSDIVDKGFDPLAFRLLVLQAHYRNQINFTWESLMAAQNRLRDLQAFADLKWQSDGQPETTSADFDNTKEEIKAKLADDLNTPEALSVLGALVDQAAEKLINKGGSSDFDGFLKTVDAVFGLGLSARPDISQTQKSMITEREKTRDGKDWVGADKLRADLAEQGIDIKDTSRGPIWSRL